MATEEKIISNAVRQDQMKMLTIYKEASKSDATLIQFLRNMKNTISKILEDIDAS